MATTAPPDRITDLDRLPFDNRFTRELPADPEAANHRRHVHGAAYSRVRPTPVAAPEVLAWSEEVAALLGLDPEVARSPDAAQVFAGNRVPAGADPFAACYGGRRRHMAAGASSGRRCFCRASCIGCSGAG